MSVKKVILVIGVIAVLVGGVLFYNRTAIEEVRKSEYTVARGDMSVSILSTGTVSPQNRLEIKPPVSGRAEKILVSEGDKLKKGQVLVWMSSSERAALIDAASARGPEELAQWKDMYRETPVMAPINGSLIKRNIEPGQTFSYADAILIMSDRLTVKAEVDETDISRIQLKQNATIIVDAYPNEKIPATVAQIAFEAKVVNNVTTYVVDVLPVKTPDFMRSGMTGNVTFHIAEKPQVLFIPADAIKVVRGVSVVTLKVGNDEVEREINTGLVDGKRVEVVDGLVEGDVILIPEFKLEGKKNGSSPFGGPAGRPRGK